MLASLVVLAADLALLLAQPTPPGGGGGITPVPLDGGIAALAVVGGAYAMHRLRKRP